jgi:hypothetical protein
VSLAYPALTVSGPFWILDFGFWIRESDRTGHAVTDCVFRLLELPSASAFCQSKIQNLKSKIHLARHLPLIHREKQKRIEAIHKYVDVRFLRVLKTNKRRQMSCFGQLY